MSGLGWRARVALERVQAAWTLLRGRGSVMTVTVGERDREFLAVERRPR